MFDWVEKIAFNEASPLTVQAQDTQFGFHRKKPAVMEHSHWHGHIEINYLFDCSADYLINGQEITVPEGRMIIFWASFPHQMTASRGNGELVNIYIPLPSFLTWMLPSGFVSQLLHGEVIVSDSLYACDKQLTQIWETDIKGNEPLLTSQVINEIRGRIRRMSIEQYSTYELANKVVKREDKPVFGGLNHIQTMLRYIADNYDQKITIENVSSSTGLHKNYAMKLFNRVMKVSIKQYINQLRLQHAQALLIDTQSPVLNIALEAGFGSVSRFYDIFQREFAMSPLEFRRKVNG
ncbi:transcriptional regulator, AraC family [Shewanella halifaxensis HAW-EB4]|uniref:Transcriptional regulator, AraC family n=1 Tax=Shewanella halifaxensis (strain HAW-EB4) TaxID=458817 RepID=B0TKY8_SHEHH|nr:helix-turn-helix domain-containing protein [Shewanella halifaxensis]ABZ77190.1 transcriptional regulator, AraC family [Shewanella halifaxensis HAW-EB4]